MLGEAATLDERSVPRWVALRAWLACAVVARRMVDASARAVERTLGLWPAGCEQCLRRAPRAPGMLGEANSDCTRSHSADGLLGGAFLFERCVATVEHNPA